MAADADAGIMLSHPDYSTGFKPSSYPSNVGVSAGIMMGRLGYSSGFKLSSYPCNVRIPVGFGLVSWVRFTPKNQPALLLMVTDK